MSRHLPRELELVYKARMTGLSTDLFVPTLVVFHFVVRLGLPDERFLQQKERFILERAEIPLREITTVLD